MASTYGDRVEKSTLRKSRSAILLLIIVNSAKFVYDAISELLGDDA
ncbi:MAG: hypothetical protein OEY49_09415 [Candidatus Heimdallarchaeota archaeon]|nr:hypothetical protein [Candidatus Heimdallarchaeota archaeon]